MKSLLFQIGILAAVIAPFLGPYLVVDLYLGLSQPLPELAGFTGLGLAFFLFFRWLRRQRQLEEEVIETFSDPILGEVICRRDSWEGTLDLGGSFGCIHVSGITPRPTVQQRSTASQLPERLSALLEASSEAARDVLGDEGRNVSPSDLVLESIFLDESVVGTFGMTFEVPRFKGFLRWGLSVDFDDYQVESAEALH